MPHVSARERRSSCRTERHRVPQLRSATKRVDWRIHLHRRRGSRSARGCLLHVLHVLRRILVAAAAKHGDVCGPWYCPRQPSLGRKLDVVTNVARAAVRRSTIAGCLGPDHMDEVIEGFTGKDGAECSSASHVSQACACAREHEMLLRVYRHWCIWRMHMAVLGNHSSCNGLLRHDQRHAVLSCQSLCAKPPPLRPKAVVHHTCPRHGGECSNIGRVL